MMKLNSCGLKNEVYVIKIINIPAIKERRTLRSVTVCRVVKWIHDPYQIDNIGHVWQNLHLCSLCLYCFFPTVGAILVFSSEMLLTGSTVLSYLRFRP